MKKLYFMLAALLAILCFSCGSDDSIIDKSYKSPSFLIENIESTGNLIVKKEATCDLVITLSLPKEAKEPLKLSLPDMIFSKPQNLQGKLTSNPLVALKKDGNKQCVVYALKGSPIKKGDAVFKFVVGDEVKELTIPVHLSTPDDKATFKLSAVDNSPFIKGSFKEGVASLATNVSFYLERIDNKEVDTNIDLSKLITVSSFSCNPFSAQLMIPMKQQIVLKKGSKQKITYKISGNKPQKGNCKFVFKLKNHSTAIEKNIYILPVDDKGRTPLHLAVREDDVEKINDFINNKGVDVDIKADMGFTPLHMAAKYKKLKAIKALIEKDANIKAITKKSSHSRESTPFHLAVMGYKTPEMRAETIRAIADALKDEKKIKEAINIKDCDGYTPFSIAINPLLEESGRLDLIKTLLELRAELPTEKLKKEIAINNLKEVLNQKANNTIISEIKRLLGPKVSDEEKQKLGIKE